MTSAALTPRIKAKVLNFDIPDLTDEFSLIFFSLHKAVICIELSQYKLYNYKMANLQAVRGTKDIFPKECEFFRFINNTAYQLAAQYGYGEIQTPIFEFTEVFHKTLGETSDIVGKEMYTFTDRGGESITLRPEGTAGISRAFISEGLAQQIPLKYYYCGPMFRYERPQKGRQRQFNQLGVEFLGVASPLADIECLALSYDLFRALKLDDKAKLELNTIGDLASREKYREALVQYLQKYKNDLSEDSKTRLEKNPLRILDSKDAGDQKILIDAPSVYDHLNTESLNFFNQVKEGLEALGIAYSINSKLVRGLDYYCQTVFEWTTDHLGAQGTLLAGGRYDGLIGMMGGPTTPGVGWASGIERLILLLEGRSFPITTKNIAVIAAEETTQNEALKLSHFLRTHGFKVEQPFSGNMGKKMKRADKLECEWACILGSTEVSQKLVMLKNLKTGEQKLIPQAELLTSL
jgi:histidyl-tRNA synthetase